MNATIPILDSTELLARSVLSYIDRIKNVENDNGGLGLLKTLIQTLVDLCNTKFLHEFPLEVVEVSIDKICLEINNSYHPDLTFSEIPSFVVENLEKAERLSDPDQCIDALRVLVNYSNIIIFSRFNYGLEIREKRLDVCNESSNRLVYDQPSNHSVNGDDNHG